MIIAINLLLILCLFFLAGAIPRPAVDVLAVFHTPVFFVLLVLLALLCLVWSACYLGRRWTSRTLFFLAVHLGVASLLAGAALGTFRGERTQFAATVGAAPESVLPGPDNRTIPLPFSLAITSFRAEHYPPSYHLYEPAATAGDDYVLLGTYRFDHKGRMVLPDMQELSDDELCDENGVWSSQMILASGQLLHRGSAAPSHFSATAQIIDPARPDEKQEMAFGVNWPLCYGDWRFYLMSYDTQDERYVVLSARRDPGRPLVIAGLWLMIVGCAGLCWQKRPLPPPPPALPAMPPDAEAPMADDDPATPLRPQITPSFGTTEDAAL